MALHLFGLTGGIASGKSTVAARFRARGVPVLDADEFAREVVAAGTDGLAEVVRAFGDGVLTPDGTLDRKAVAAIVFADEAKRRALNAIVHPRIAALGMHRTAELDARGEPLACYEAALLVENGLADMFRPLVVVAVPEDVQVARARARDGATEEEAAARIRSQMPLAKKVALADFVIDNVGTRDALTLEADRVLHAVCARCGVDADRYVVPAAARA